MSRSGSGRTRKSFSITASLAPAALPTQARRRIIPSMSTVTIALPDSLHALLLERMTAVGAHSKEEYLLDLIEADCAASELEQVLIDRAGGPFEPLENDWKARVRHSAAKLREA